jgi:hydrogenase maturation protease
VLVTEVGTALLDAVHLLSWADRAIVIDALHAQSCPGTIYWASYSEILHRKGSLSLHEFDLSAALAFMPRDATKPEIFVLGVQPASLDMGLELSPAVAAAIPLISLNIDQKLTEWRKERHVRV